MDKEYMRALTASMFQELTDAEKDYLLQYAKLRRVAPGELVVKQGEQGDCFYLILQGQMAVYRLVDDEDLPQRVQLATLREGMSFGEAALMFKQPRSADVEALTPAVLLVIDGQQLSNAVDEIAQRIYQKLLHRLTVEFSKRIIYFDDQLLRVDLDQTDADATTPASSVSSMLSPRLSARTADMLTPSSILVLFGWRWRDIMHEVPFLAEHGYDAIKISPPQEFAVREGNPWWAVYQPVSYYLSNYWGSEEDFVQMVDFCHSYDLKIYADLVLNHMAEYPETIPNANNDNNNDDDKDAHRHDLDSSAPAIHGTNGTPFTRYHYGPLNAQQDYWRWSDFYHYDPQGNGNRQIDNQDYCQLDGVWHLEHYDFLNLPKLDLTNPHVMSVLRRYIQYLLRLGVDGFRIDAAKHLNMPAVRKIFKGLTTRSGHPPFIYQEYYTGAPMGVDLYSYMEKYFKLGYVTSFKYGEFLAEVFTGRANSLEKLAAFSFGSTWLQLPSNRTVTVIDNHDTERMMENMLNFGSTSRNAYVLAYIFMLAWPFGVPKIMSSFRFNGHDDGYPTESVWVGDQDHGFATNSRWVLQHRWQAIANMVLFHRRTASAPGLAHIWMNGNQLAFARVHQETGKSISAVGFVAINATGRSLKQKFDTGLPDGKYYDLIKSRLQEGRMHGPTVQITNYGKTEIELPPYDAMALVLTYRCE